MEIPPAQKKPMLVRGRAAEEKELQTHAGWGWCLGIVPLSSVERAQISSGDLGVFFLTAPNRRVARSSRSSRDAARGTWKGRVDRGLLGWWLFTACANSTGRNQGRSRYRSSKNRGTQESESKKKKKSDKFSTLAGFCLFGELKRVVAVASWLAGKGVPLSIVLGG